MYNIGDAIRSARCERGLTVYALAKRTGVSTSHLYAIEDGKKSPSMEFLAKVLPPLGLRLEVVEDARR